MGALCLQFAQQKASELEDYQSVGLAGTELEGDDEPAVKKRKLAKQVRTTGQDVGQGTTII